MKKLLSIVALAAFMTACNDSSTKVDSTAGDTSSVSSDAAKTDTSSVTPAPATNSSAAVKEGMMIMKDAKMMVVKNGAWEKMDEAVTCTNGCKVMTNGEVSKNGKKKMMTEGMMIDKDGQMVDADGKLVDDTAWK